MLEDPELVAHHDRDRPRLKVKPGVDASKLVFATDRWRPRGGKRNA